MKRLYLDYYFVKPNTSEIFLKLGCVQVAINEHHLILRVSFGFQGDRAYHQTAYALLEIQTDCLLLQY